MSTFSVPYVFTNGQTADAGQVNANFNALIAAGNNINSVNLGGLGIYASQIVPTSAAQATFGGTIPYAFPSGLTASGTLTTTGDVSAGNGFFSGDMTLSGLLYFGNGAGVLQKNAAENLLYSAASQTGGWRFANAGNTADLFKLSNAGNGVFTGFVSATSFTVSNASTAAFSFANQSSGTFFTELSSQSAVYVSGVPANIFLITARGYHSVLALDNPGNLGITGTVFAGSARASKAHISELEPAAASKIVDATTIVRYSYKGEAADGPRHIGFIADDTHPDIAPGGVAMSLNSTICVVMQAVKELRAEFQAYVAAHP